MTHIEESTDAHGSPVFHVMHGDERVATYSHRHEADGHGKGKAEACWTFVYPNTTVVGVSNDERLAIDIANGQGITPAVAITVEAYNEVRTRLADMAANALHAHERGWTRDTLAMLPEVPHD